MTTSPKTAGWETPDVMRQDAYTIHHTPKQKRPQEKEKNIYTYRCALSALQRPPAEGNIPADKARHTRCPGFEQPGATPGPPYYERTLSACAMSRTDAQRAGRPGRATERTTAQRTGALLPPLAPLAAPAEIKTMATLRLRDRRENDVILRGPEAIIPQAM